MINVSDDALKQECESRALPRILDRLKGRFPRLGMCILLDALYANGPTMSILKQNGFDFAIVRKKSNSVSWLILHFLKLAALSKGI